MRLLPFARLLRLPNVFTAFADVALALCCVAHFAPELDAAFPARAALLFLASGCLYCGGMVWNDYFDLAEDRRDRPFRPLPSGQIASGTAARLGTLLMLVGWGAAAASGVADAGFRPAGAVVGGLLVVAILAYNARIKRTPAGPVGMAACRFLNVLLGLTLAEPTLVTWPVRLHLAAAVGLYIAGVTWFARTEEKRSDSSKLALAAAVVAAALVVALAVPTRVAAGSAPPLFPYLLLAFAFLIGRPVLAAVAGPTPANVQRAVKRCVLGLVVLDAVLATAFVGVSGLLILALLPPALWLGQWVYST